MPTQPTSPLQDVCAYCGYDTLSYIFDHMAKSTETVFWFDDNHRAWSTNNETRAVAKAWQSKSDTLGIAISSIGCILAVIFGISSGDWGTFFAYLLLFAGVVMLLGNIRDVLRN